jgi:hypothetical protein
MANTPVRTIETVGAIVRGPYGSLSVITEVIESSRCSDSHLTTPGDVVVRVRPHGVGYGHTSAWASELTLAEPGDIGAHPHWADCTCGAQPANPQPWCRWVHVPATWETD